MSRKQMFAQETSQQDESFSCINVALRVRPLLETEAKKTQCVKVFETNNDGKSSECYPTMIRVGGQFGTKFTFDRVFGSSSSQLDIFEGSVVPLLRNCLDGYNATILAYGQTAAGKTHTMIGERFDGGEDEACGIVPRTIKSIFKKLDSMQTKAAENQKQQKQKKKQKQQIDSINFQYEIRLQILEMYGEEIRDLLSSDYGKKKKLTIRDFGNREPEVIGAKELKVETSEIAIDCLIKGLKRRVTGPTCMNKSSSRSHVIISISIEQTIQSRDKSSKNVQIKKSRFNFVDLAGAERRKRLEAREERLKEAIDINKGLLVLGNVISALGDPKKRGKTFVPYRDSKLTRLLRGSLGGNHKTLMVACISPSFIDMDESMNCLRYANRAKNIRNRASVHVQSDSCVVDQLNGQLKALATDLSLVKQGLNGGDFKTEYLKSVAYGKEKTTKQSIPTQARAKSLHCSQNSINSKSRQRAVKHQKPESTTVRKIRKTKTPHDTKITLSRCEKSNKDNDGQQSVITLKSIADSIKLLNLTFNNVDSDSVSELNRLDLSERTYLSNILQDENSVNLQSKTTRTSTSIEGMHINDLEQQEAKVQELNDFIVDLQTHYESEIKKKEHFAMDLEQQQATKVKEMESLITDLKKQQADEILGKDEVIAKLHQHHTSEIIKMEKIISDQQIKHCNETIKQSKTLQHQSRQAKEWTQNLENLKNQQTEDLQRKDEEFDELQSKLSDVIMEHAEVIQRKDKDLKRMTKAVNEAAKIIYQTGATGQEEDRKGNHKSLSSEKSKAVLSNDPQNRKRSDSNLDTLTMMSISHEYEPRLEDLRTANEIDSSNDISKLFDPVHICEKNNDTLLDIVGKGIITNFDEEHIEEELAHLGNEGVNAICEGISPLATNNEAVKVLLEMIGREKMLFSHLERTASKLEIRLLNIMNLSRSTKPVSEIYSTNIYKDSDEQLLELDEKHQKQCKALLVSLDN